MTQPITIPKALPQSPTLNYDLLREEGIRHIQRLAGHIWTDHNTHDPGITILEQLCYAITDLGYRIDHDMKDLLGTQEEGGAYRHLYGPASILTVNPVTLLDIRKVVIDIPGVKNAWVEKVAESNGLGNLKGLYRVVFEKNESTNVQGSLLDRVKERLFASRGMCEDFAEIKQLDAQFIQLHGTIEVGNVEDIHSFAADVLLRAASFISPVVPFYSLQALLEKGKKIEDIFDGPVLSHGFIDDAELLRTSRKTEIHSSDIIREMMDQQGVLAVNDFALSTGSGKKMNWVLPLDMAKTPKLDVQATLDTLFFAKQGLRASIDTGRVSELYLMKRDQLQFEVLPESERDIVLPAAEDRGLEKYYSVQNHFPANYGIGTLGLSESAPPSRRAGAKQLKGYLLFFEQLLANYFSQIAHFKDLVGFDGQDRRTYFNQSLLGVIPGLEEVIISAESYQNYLEEMASESPSGLARKNAFLNHLLARFSETFTDYGMLLHHPENSRGPSAAQKLITDKSNFLQDYPALSSGRAKGYHYQQESWDSDNVSGLEKRIARKLGIEDVRRRNLGDEDREGFHLVEHILLRTGATALLPENPSAGAITGFEASSQEGWTKCIAPNHLQKAGADIRIFGSAEFDGRYSVAQILPDSFEIEVPFVAPGPQLGNGISVQWTRAQVDLRDLVLTDRIDGFAAAGSPDQTLCSVAQHGLRVGDSVEIVGTEHYNGTYTLESVSEDSFVIQRAFSGNESAGRWKPLKMGTDLYSLQLTFVFPVWTDRYKDGNFQRFVENRVREETPAHLTTHVQWLPKTEMQRFDQAYHRFLTTLIER